MGGSVTVRLIPAPRGTSIVAAGVSKKLLQMAGIDDCYTSACGTTATAGNFAMATYLAVAQTYSYLTPDMWAPTDFGKSRTKNSRITWQRITHPAVLLPFQLLQ